MKNILHTKTQEFLLYWMPPANDRNSKICITRMRIYMDEFMLVYVSGLDYNVLEKNEGIYG